MHPNTQTDVLEKAVYVGYPSLLGGCLSARHLGGSRGAVGVEGGGRLVGLVVKASASRVGDPDSIPACAVGDFSG